MLFRSAGKRGLGAGKRGLGAGHQNCEQVCRIPDPEPNVPKGIKHGTALRASQIVARGGCLYLSNERVRCLAITAHIRLPGPDPGISVPVKVIKSV